MKKILLGLVIAVMMTGSGYAMEYSIKLRSCPYLSGEMSTKWIEMNVNADTNKPKQADKNRKELAELSMIYMAHCMGGSKLGWGAR